MDATTALAVISIVAAVAIFVYLALAPSAHESSKAGMSAAAAPKAAAPAPVARPELKDFTIAGACQRAAWLVVPLAWRGWLATGDQDATSPARTRAHTFPRAELAEYNGTDASKPLLLAADGFVFDVSAGRTFYGPGGPYGKMAGR